MTAIDPKRPAAKADLSRPIRHPTIELVYDVGMRHFSESHLDARWMRASVAYQTLSEEVVAQVALATEDFSVPLLEQRGACAGNRYRPAASRANLNCGG